MTTRSARRKAKKTRLPKQLYGYLKSGRLRNGFDLRQYAYGLSEFDLTDQQEKLRQQRIHEYRWKRIFSVATKPIQFMDAVEANGFLLPLTSGRARIEVGDWVKVCVEA